METQKIDKETARKEALAMLDGFENIIMFGFRKNGDSALVTVTEDEIYDRLGQAMAKQLEILGKEIEEECKEYS